ncbi:hypothetical protein D3OALGA1CA_1350 [Olavius algarvensis associated proteobacterium Delta 3]|nr:hypothetical protein D3OALGA1CA_1350 [Olavius algarvensis associated proteobacterium Delta 3]CAB5124421.1 hypothetical protein D3OALGB2SA_3186 [Olavius algarvensis associated proteobacterium Delta 3]
MVMGACEILYVIEFSAVDRNLLENLISKGAPPSCSTT